MRIIVLVKEVPDTYGARTLNLETGLAERDAGDRVLDEIGERALEAALSFADAHTDTEVVLLSMGPEQAAASLRKGLAMGASRAVQVTDDALRGADLWLTAEVLAAAIRHIGFDLVIAGNQSTDGSAGVLPAMLAELLGVVNATGLSAVQIEADRLSGSREVDGGMMRVSAALPAVASITERLPDARLSTFKGIMAAKRKPFDTLTLAELGIDADDPAAPRSIMTAISERPRRAAGTIIIDDGTAGEKLAEYLVQNRLA